MGKRTFPRLAAALIAHGLPPDTPALLAESVSHPGQKLHRAGIARIAEMLAGLHSTQPALILYGALAPENEGNEA
jgi:uroporphyrin-III C-methyltransferase